MNIKEFKEWINSLPEEFNVFEMVYRKYGDLVDDKYYAKDEPIDAAIIDEETHELAAMNDESYDFYEKKQNNDIAK